MTLGSSEALRYRGWHADRVRGLDHDGVWLGRSHLARVDRARLPDYGEAREVGSALHLSMPRARPRADLARLSDALEALLPSRSAADARRSARAL